MNSLFEEKELLFLAAIVAIATLLPHPENVTPIAALGLFSGTYLTKKIYLMTPVLASFVVDMNSVGFYNIPIQIFVYIGFLLSSITGRLILQNKRVLMRLPLAILISSISFYLLSNFAIWLTYYPQSLEGMVNCYVNALPYLARSLLGNVIYSGIFFGLYELMLMLRRRQVA